MGKRKMSSSTLAGLQGVEALEEIFFQGDSKWQSICQDRDVEAKYCRDFSEVQCLCPLTLTLNSNPRP